MLLWTIFQKAFLWDKLNYYDGEEGESDVAIEWIDLNAIAFTYYILTTRTSMRAAV